MNYRAKKLMLRKGSAKSFLGYFVNPLCSYLYRGRWGRIFYKL